MQALNIVRLNQNSVSNDIQSFLRNKGVKSKNTEVAYENDIRQFFKFMIGKDIEKLVESDLNFKNSDMLQYQTFLYREFKQPNGDEYSNTSINRKIRSIISLFRFLKRNEYNVDPDVLVVDDLPDDTKQIGFLTVDEINSMLLMTNNEELKAFIMLALHTSMRKGSILTLEWSQIEQKHDEPEYYIIRTMDKNKQDFKEIHVSVYEMLLSIKKEGKYVFTTPSSTMDYRFKTLCKRAGIDYRSRKVSIHSLRKAGVDFVKTYTGDLQAAQAQATHSSPSVTSAIYTQKPKNLAARLLVENVDEKIFDKMSRDELLELVRMQSNGIGHKLKMDAKRIVEGRL